MVAATPAFTERSFKATYVGHTPVLAASGHDVVRAAREAIKRGKSKRAKVILLITGERVCMLDRKNSAVVQAAAVDEISFVSLDAHNKNNVRALLLLLVVVMMMMMMCGGRSFSLSSFRCCFFFFCPRNRLTSADTGLRVVHRSWPSSRPAARA